MSAPYHQPPLRQEALTLARNKVWRRNDIEDGLEQSLVHGPDMRLIARAIGERAARVGIDYEAVGGQGVYAHSLAAAVAMNDGSETGWFAVRGEPKKHGHQGRWFEGFLIQGASVMLVDTVAHPELLDVCRIVQGEGAQLTGVMPLYDPNDIVRKQMAEQFPDVRYVTLFPATTLNPART